MNLPGEPLIYVVLEVLDCALNAFNSNSGHISRLQHSMTEMSQINLEETHIKDLLDVKLVADAIAEDVLVLSYESDVGVGQIHPRFLRERGHSDTTAGGGR